MTQVLIVAKATPMMDELASTLANNGCQVEQRGDGNGIVLAAETAWELLIVDPEHSPNTESVLSQLPRIVVAENATIKGAVVAIRDGAQDYLSIPVVADELMAAVERALLAGSTTSAPTFNASEYTIIGNCAEIEELRSRIQRVANTDTPVLLHGEPGTGKELAARAIHAASQRRNRPLITVNCAAIPSAMLEAELFGQRTDASASANDSKGLADAADGGTLFLDDVAELSAEVQARLLRLMQVGEIRPVGSAYAHSANVRVIAATHRDLRTLVNTGQFREDLFFRLNVMYAKLPPLHARGEDILQLSDWLLQQTVSRLGKNVQSFSPEARQALLSYNWPGNVRELGNAIERAVILAESPVLTPELLAIGSEVSPPTTAASDGQDQTTLEDYFVRFVLDNEEHFTETELAEKLGISRKSLWERRQRLNIPRRKTKTRGPRRSSDSDQSDGA